MAALERELVKVLTWLAIGYVVLKQLLAESRAASGVMIVTQKASAAWRRCKLKEFKRIAMRADKTDQSFKANIYLAAAIIHSR